MSTIRKEIQDFIDTMQDYQLEALKPMLTLLVNDNLNIETDLTTEEAAIIAQGRKKYANKPDSFVSLDTI